MASEISCQPSRYVQLSTDRGGGQGKRCKAKGGCKLEGAKGEGGAKERERGCRGGAAKFRGGAK